MPQFSYRARRRSGELVEGVLDVADRPAAVAQIERLGLFPVAVDTAKAGAANGTQRLGKGVDLLAFLPPTLRAQLRQKRKPKLQELATFTQQLANLIQSGMPLTLALNSMTHLESKGISADVSRELKQEVTEGKGLSDAMAKQPRVFSDLYVNMVRAGEQSGSLVEVLRRLANHFQQFAEVQSKFTSALIYAAVHGDFQRVRRRTAIADAPADGVQQFSQPFLVAARPARHRGHHFIQTLSSECGRRADAG